MSVSLNPFVTTNTTTAFQEISDGYVVGTALDDPGRRYSIEGGVISSSQSTPLYGGLPLTLNVPTPNSSTGASAVLGPVALLATAEANIDAWCVFNDAAAGVITGSSQVPLYSAGNSINFIRQGCGLFLVLPIKPADVATLEGEAVNTAIYWDFTHNWVTVSAMGTALGYQVVDLNTNSKGITYSAGPPITANWAGSTSVVVVRV